MPDPYSVTKCAELLAGTKALTVDWLEDSHIALFGDATHFRAWPLESTHYAPQLLAYLDDYTDAGNATPQTYVQNPTASEQTWPGYWGGATHRRIRRGDKTFIVQGLRQVFVLAAVSDLAALTPQVMEQEEILQAFGLQPGEADRIALRYVALAADTQDLCLAIPSNTLMLQLIRPTMTAWTDPGTYALGDVRYYLANDGTADFRCVLGYMTPALAIAPSLDTEHWIPFGPWVYVDRKWTVQPDGTAEFAFLFEVRRWDAAWSTSGTSSGDEVQLGQSGVHTAGTDPNEDATGWAEVKIEQLTGVPIADRATLLSRLQSANSQYVTSSVQIHENARDGYLAASREQRRKFEGDADTDAIILVLAGARYDRPARLARWWPRRSLAALTALIGASGKAVSGYSFTFPADASATSLFSDRTNITDNGDTTYDVRQELSTQDPDDDGFVAKENRYAWMKYGQEIEYRPTPTDGGHAGHQYRMHFRKVERLYTNSKAYAYTWANHDYTDSGGTTAEGIVYTCAWLEPVGDSGGQAIVWGDWRERETGQTRYVAYRCTQDYRTTWHTAATGASNAKVTT